jgi:Ca-activated chloride channel family protein
MKDNRGETVMSALNEEMCRQVAEAGGGAYIHVGNNSRAQDQLENELDKLAKKEIEQNVYSDYDEQFQAVAILALLMLVLEICILEVKNPRLSRISLFSRKKTDSGDGSLHLRLMLLMAVLVCSQFLPTMVMGQSDRRLVRQGNSQFKKGNAAEAEVKYRKALEQNPRNAQAAYNLGTAMMNQHKDSTVAAQLMDAARLEINPLRRAQAYHNMGVMLQQNRQYGEAIEAYKEALRNNPADDATRYNLELCKHQQKKQQQQQQQQQQQKQDDQKKQDDQQKQDNKQQQKKQEQEPKQQMSKENAEQLLNAAIQEEKNTQERMKKAMQQPQRRSREKNW